MHGGLGRDRRIRDPASSGPTEATGSDVTPAGVTSPASPGPQQTQLEMARDHLKHLVFFVQENRSFDHYFGTFPGADGIPMRNGRPRDCIPDPIAGHCVRPYHSRSQLQQGGPHDEPASKADVNGGRMDGFVKTVIAGHEYCADYRADPHCEPADAQPSGFSADGAGEGRPSSGTC